MSFEKRLREERKRLGLNQPEFGALGGLVKKTIIEYEKGITYPDAKFLLAIAAAGADVNYILTGQHSVGESNPGYSLRPDQKALLDNYEHCLKEDQDAIKRLALRSAEAIDKEIPQPETPLNNDNQGNDDDRKNRIQRT